MITVHNTDTSVTAPIKSSIVMDKVDSTKVVPAKEGYEAYSGKSVLTWPSAYATNDGSDATADAGALRAATMDNVNRSRFIDVAITHGADDLTKVVADTGAVHLLTASKFGNWRNYSVNGFAEISKRVQLQQPTISAFDYDISYEFTDLGSVVLKNKLAENVSKISDTVNNLAYIAGAVGGSDKIMNATLPGQRMAMYQSLPVGDASKVTTTPGLSSVEFQFKFGQAGLFSGEEEVVKPILAMIMPFTPKGGGMHSFLTPYGNKNIAERLALLKIMDILTKGGIGSKLNMDLSGGFEGAVAGAVRGFNSIVDLMYGIIDDVATTVLGMETTLVFCIGSLIAGPFLAGNIKWSFDFNNVDEYGFPCAGTVTYGSLKPLRTQLGGDYLSQWGYGKKSISPLPKELQVKLKEEAELAADTVKAIEGADPKKLDVTDMDGNVES